MDNISFEEFLEMAKTRNISNICHLKIQLTEYDQYIDLNNIMSSTNISKYNMSSVRDLYIHHINEHGLLEVNDKYSNDINTELSIRKHFKSMDIFIRFETVLYYPHNETFSIDGIRLLRGDRDFSDGNAEPGSSVGSRSRPFKLIIKDSSDISKLVLFLSNFQNIIPENIVEKYGYISSNHSFFIENNLLMEGQMNWKK